MGASPVLPSGDRPLLCNSIALSCLLQVNLLPEWAVVEVRSPNELRGGLAWRGPSQGQAVGRSVLPPEAVENLLLLPSSPFCLQGW